MRSGGCVVMIGSLLLATLLAPAVGAHEQKTLTVILTDDGVVAGNVTDVAFVQGNSVWFRMEDSTNNTTMVVQIDTNLDGVFNASDDFDSGELVNACELDENGSLVDETCAVSATHQFMQNATVGTYLFWVHRNHNGSQTVWNHSITVNKDVHEEDGPSPGDCFGIGCDVDEGEQGSEAKAWSATDSPMVLVLAAISLIGMVALTISIATERREDETPSLTKPEPIVIGQFKKEEE
jgi:hypothetical protein